MIKKSNFVPWQGSPIVFLGKILYSHNALPLLPAVKLGGAQGEETLQWCTSGYEVGNGFHIHGNPGDALYTKSITLHYCLVLLCEVYCVIV